VNIRFNPNYGTEPPFLISIYFTFLLCVIPLIGSHVSNLE